jgi:hypothetical protein
MAGYPFLSLIAYIITIFKDISMAPLFPLSDLKGAYRQ